LTVPPGAEKNEASSLNWFTVNRSVQLPPGKTLQTPSIPLPLLITGVAGVAGYNALAYFQQQYPGQVIGLRRANNWPLSGTGIVGCDIHDQQELQRLFDEHQFRSVLHCEGTCKLKSCELDPALAERVNVAGVASLLQAASSRPLRLIHLSVDLVFSGKGAGGYQEDDATDPVTVYGRTMVDGEQLVLQQRPDACILRISLPMGISFNGHAGAIDWIQSRFQKHKPATLYFDEVRTPSYTDCLNSLFAELLCNDMAGLYHTGGPRASSLYQIAQIVNRTGGYDPDLLIGCPRIEAGPMPPRAGNVTLDSSRLTEQLGRQPLDPWPLDEGLLPTSDDWHHLRPAGRQYSPLELVRVLYHNPSAASG
jgi:dTDP-4-dehydrorhamnose reductase